MLFTIFTRDTDRFPMLPSLIAYVRLFISFEVWNVIVNVTITLPWLSKKNETNIIDGVLVEWINLDRCRHPFPKIKNKKL